MLHRGSLDLVLGRKGVQKVIGEWRKAAEVAQALGQHHREVRLHVAILARLDEHDPAAARSRAQLAERCRVLEIDDPSIFPPPWSRAPGLSGGVEIEGEAQGQIV
jgi:hypothetical protein